MPVELTIVETTVELGQTNVEVILESASAPGPAGPGVPAGGTLNQVLTKDSGTDYDTSWQDAQGASGGAPDDATYLVTAAHADLSAEVVVGATPGGELGGTWASPTVDASHSGSTHAAVQAAAEATAAAALATHEGDTTAIHGIADTSALALTANHPSNATFNDHSARHEDGGADEISLTGLSGTPAALTTHEADTSNVHGITDTTVLATDAEVATAVSDHSADTTSVHGIADTSALALTANHPTNATFNDHSARHENGGADPISLAGLGGIPTELQTHLDDTTAHLAANVPVADAGGNYTGGDVEAVLAEIAPQLGDMALLYDNTLLANTASIDTGASGIAQTHDHLLVLMVLRSTQAVTEAGGFMQFNADAGSNYDKQSFLVDNTTVTGVISLAQTQYVLTFLGASAQAGAFGALEFWIPAYRQTTAHKSFTTKMVAIEDTAGDCRTEMGGGRWRSTAAISRLAVGPASGNLLAGSRVSIFGIRG